MTTLLVFNPAAGQRDRVALAGRVASLLENGGEVVSLEPTRRAGHASEIVEAALRARDDVESVVVMGGDGTLNEALTGAWQAGVFEREDAAPRFGVVPVGTANVIARDLGLPLEPLAAAALLAEGATRPFDLGLCRMPQGVRPFLLSAGAGIEAETIATLDLELKRRAGSLAYLWSGVLAAGARKRGLSVSLELPNGSRLADLAPASVVIGNARFYGGAFRLARSARSDDGLLEVVLLGSTALVPLMVVSLSAAVGAVSLAPGTQLVQARRVLVESSEPVAMHVDAETAGTTPAEVSVRRRGVTLRAPARPTATA